MSLYDNPVKFSSLCDLITAIGSTEPKSIQSRLRKKKSISTLNSISNLSGSGSTSSAGLLSQGNKSVERLENWLGQLNRFHSKDRIEDEEEAFFTTSSTSPLTHHLPYGTSTIFFRLFYPEEGVRRRYGLKESNSINHLEKYFNKKKGRFNFWDNNFSLQSSSGCLGIEIQKLLERDKDKFNFRPNGLELSFGRVEQLLDELASKSPFSSKEVRALNKSRPISQILKNLLDPCTSSEKAIMIQIILQDLTPILYPLPKLSRLALIDYNTKAYDRLALIDSMRVWDKRMSGLYRIKADLDVVTRELEDSNYTEDGKDIWTPTIGVAIQVPKSERPGIASIATKNLTGLVAVENKYDGERLQIHVDTSLPYFDQIQIFSKSGRDSSDDRKRLLPIIRVSLGLPLPTEFSAFVDARLLRRAPDSFNFSTNAKYILEGEMVSYNESESRIDEFWTLPFVKAGFDPSTNMTSTNPNLNPISSSSVAGDSQDSIETGHTESYEASLERRRSERIRKRTENNLNLMVVWFDLLLVGNESLLDCPYEERRIRLNSLLQVIPGYSMLAEQIVIDFTHQHSALTNLIDRFAEVIVSRGEGLMLKPLQSKYNDNRKGQKWVKLKKDFIPGAGDTLDFYILGATWSKKRGRDLGVGPSILTTFYVGLKCNSAVPGAWKPHYHILFTTSYGLNREQLATLNAKISLTSPQSFNPDSLQPKFKEYSVGSVSAYGNDETSFIFSIDKSIASKGARPTVIFRDPRIFELVGAGFQKSGGSLYYSLRWPRITKFDRKKDESDPVDLERLQAVALDAMQINPNTLHDNLDYHNSSTDHNSWTTSTEQKNLQEQKKEWIEKLRRVDKAFGRSRGSVPQWDSVEKIFNTGIELDWTSSGSISIPSSSAMSSSSSIKRYLPNSFIDEGYASEEGTAFQQTKKMRPLGSATNLTSRKGKETSRTISARKAITIYIDPPVASLASSTPSTALSTPILSAFSSNNPTASYFSPATSIPSVSSSTPDSPVILSDASIFSEPVISSSTFVSSPTVFTSSKSLSFVSKSLSVSASVPTLCCRKSIQSSNNKSVSFVQQPSNSVSWSCIPPSLPVQSYSWVFIFTLSLTRPTKIRPSIPCLEPFSPSNFYYEPFLVLQVAGWLSKSQSPSKFVEGYIVVESESEGRKIQGGIQRKFGFSISNRQKITILSLDGWKVELL